MSTEYECSTKYYFNEVFNDSRVLKPNWNVAFGQIFLVFDVGVVLRVNDRGDEDRGVENVDHEAGNEQNYEQTSGGDGGDAAVEALLADSAERQGECRRRSHFVAMRGRDKLEDAAEWEDENDDRSPNCPPERFEDAEVEHVDVGRSKVKEWT